MGDRLGHINVSPTQAGRARSAPGTKSIYSAPNRMGRLLNQISIISSEYSTIECFWLWLDAFWVRLGNEGIRFIAGIGDEAIARPEVGVKYHAKRIHRSDGCI